MKLLHQGNQRLVMVNNRRLNFPLHLQNNLELIWLRQGRSTLHWNRTRFDMVPGDILAVFPNTVHSFENSQNEDSLMLLIPLEDVGVFRSALEHNTPATPIIHRAQWADTCLDTVLEMAYRDWQNAAAVLRQGYVLLILGKLMPLLTLTPRQPSNADALQRILRYLHANYTQPLSRKQLAAVLGYHESYLSHIFSDTLGISLTQYLLQLRLNDAAGLLRTTELTVSAISARVGFGSIRSFNRAFMAELGMTPRQYRAQQEHRK